MSHTNTTHGYETPPSLRQLVEDIQLAARFCNSDDFEVLRTLLSAVALKRLPRHEKPTLLSLPNTVLRDILGLVGTRELPRLMLTCKTLNTAIESNPVLFSNLQFLHDCAPGMASMHLTQLLRKSGAHQLKVVLHLPVWDGAERAAYIAATTAHLHRLSALSISVMRVTTKDPTVTRNWRVNNRDRFVADSWQDAQQLLRQPMASLRYLNVQCRMTRGPPFATFLPDGMLGGQAACLKVLVLRMLDIPSTPITAVQNVTVFAYMPRRMSIGMDELHSIIQMMPQLVHFELSARRFDVPEDGGPNDQKLPVIGPTATLLQVLRLHYPDMLNLKQLVKEISVLAPLLRRILHVERRNAYFAFYNVSSIFAMHGHLVALRVVNCSLEVIVSQQLINPVQLNVRISVPKVYNKALAVCALSCIPPEKRHWLQLLTIHFSHWPLDHPHDVIHGLQSDGRDSENRDPLILAGLSELRIILATRDDYLLSDRSIFDTHPISPGGPLSNTMPNLETVVIEHCLPPESPCINESNAECTCLRPLTVSLLDIACFISSLVPAQTRHTRPRQLRRIVLRGLDPIPHDAADGLRNLMELAEKVDFEEMDRVEVVSNVEGPEYSWAVDRRSLLDPGLSFY
ncbi:hypothetical protein BKA62DRAFT_756383 [Auriculariales sp. MPI-PUGE-AT-0066]|nr:hypothetical protein BKA62DRAFT_756383 [Auriculariales sp. MPI-PUGE-AT-0066]